MRIDDQPQAGSYEASLNEGQRMRLHALLLSDVTLAQAQERAEVWPSGNEAGNKPSIACLARIRTRLRIEERIARVETATATRRATRNLLKRLVKGVDQEAMLDEAMTLIGEQVIDASLGMESASLRTAAAWLMLRPADQRRFDERTAIFKAQSNNDKTGAEDKPLPAMSNEELDPRYREIFGMEPAKTKPFAVAEAMADEVG